MITCGTYGKMHFLNSSAKLDLFRGLFFTCITDAGRDLHAWAILSNHYHFIASAPSDPVTLRRMISKLHTLSARDINVLDRQPGRKVWFHYFDSHITFTNSYLPRLKYVHHNPAHHGVVRCAEDYPWCSASWFARTATTGFRKTVESFKTNALSVADEFLPLSTVGTTESGVKPPHSK